MGLQLFSKRKWKDDSFNEINVKSILRDSYIKFLEKSPFRKRELLDYKNKITKEKTLND